MTDAPKRSRSSTSLRTVVRAWLPLIVAFVLGAVMVELFDPFGPRNFEACSYRLAKAGAGPWAFDVCRNMFPAPPAKALSDLGQLVEPNTKPFQGRLNNGGSQ
jgi:hypothetical protein